MSHAHILILTSCTGKKLHSPSHQLTLEDFKSLHSEHFHTREESLAEYRHRAIDLYTGQQHLRLLRGLQPLRSALDVDVHILSAGYGLIEADRPIVPYECTFQTMGNRAIRAWSSHLNISQQARRLFAEAQADLVIVILGERYLRALQLDEHFSFASPTLFITSTGALKLVPGLPNVHRLALSRWHASRYRVGLVGLKGELAARIAEEWVKQGPALYPLLDENERFFDLLDRPLPPRPEKVVPRPNPHVDKVISLSAAWLQQPHRQKLNFFIPDWDDMVDPDYDFASDTHSGGRGNWTNQVYAHQMYPSPNSDGLLVSKAVADQSKSKAERMGALGIHRYLRVPSEFPVMGDCGAFSYLLQDMPPYSTPEIVDYYSRLGFNFGVSIDHLLFGASDEEGKRRRYELTIHNAEEFIREHAKSGATWQPIGALQGLNPQQYAEAARQYEAMGYRYLGIGGQVRSRTEDILRIVKAIREVISPATRIHLFGVARTEGIHAFVQAGINSVDSASYLRQAWIRMGSNYIGHDGLYSAIRIPEARKKAARLDAQAAARIVRLEARALEQIRQPDYEVDSCLNAILEYKLSIGSQTPARLESEYRAVLERQPWKQCDCPICQRDGVEVIIFRGNNRNRRRGFHNNYVFYKLLPSLIEGQALPFPWKSVMSSSDKPIQVPLF
jgi:hypothetical protein